MAGYLQTELDEELTSRQFERTHFRTPGGTDYGSPEMGGLFSFRIGVGHTANPFWTKLFARRSLPALRLPNTPTKNLPPSSRPPLSGGGA